MTGRKGTVLVDGGQATLQFERFLAHPIDRVWSVLTGTDHLLRWYMTKGTIEPRAGGTVDMWSGAAKIHVTGKVLVWDPPHVLEHERKIAPGGLIEAGEDSVIRWELTPDGDGTRLRLLHRRLAPTMAVQILPATHALLDRLECEVAGASMPDFGRSFAEARALYS